MLSHSVCLFIFLFSVKTRAYRNHNFKRIFEFIRRDSTKHRAVSTHDDKVEQKREASHREAFDLAHGSQTVIYKMRNDPESYDKKKKRFDQQQET